MLPQSFLEWWFEPWRYATVQSSRLQDAQDPFAQRDGYRIWCVEANVIPDLLRQYDPAWCMAASRDTECIVASASLLGGLIAACNRDLDVLGALPLADRKWCLSIGSTQPLRLRSGVFMQGEESIRLCGLVELATCLDSAFPGLWSRLRLQLPEELAQEVAVLMANLASDNIRPPSANARLQRLWRLCMARVEHSL